MSSLLEENLENIFLRLQVKQPLRRRCVCKLWCTLIHTANFISKHLNLSIKEYNSTLLLKCYRPGYKDNGVEISGSCNGLLCVRTSFPGGEDEDAISLWNPSSNEYKELPSSPNEFSSEDTGLYGFAYDSQDDDYKVVRVVDYYYNNYYDTGMTSRCIRAKISDPNFVGIAFDIGTETFKDLEVEWLHLPESDEDIYNYSLGVLRRFIVSAHGFGYDSETDDYKFVDLGCISGESDKSEMHIYSLRSDSWKPAKYIPYVCKEDVLVPGLYFNGSLHCTPVDGFEIKYHSGVRGDVEVLVLYDPKDERARVLKLDKDMNPVHSQLETYVQSLVSLKPGAHRKQENKDTSKAMKV
ncbi:uncharacterized protein LOC113306402 [Papaver somniferum]|uniref:uncharacterized protein LOC113306402 n=1 Tax=Papaver somniferum TaxID=3469 RepID=UPI000E6F9CEE|nr:uncharacterized protein LOC113306402 [Papaver somniferum]